MFLCVIECGGDEFERDEFEAALLEALDDLAHEPALHGVRLQHDVAALALVSES